MFLLHRSLYIYPQLHFYYLHSTMFLLHRKKVKLSELGGYNLHSTMFLLHQLWQITDCIPW